MSFYKLRYTSFICKIKAVGNVSCSPCLWYFTISLLVFFFVKSFTWIFKHHSKNWFWVRSCRLIVRILVTKPDISYGNCLNETWGVRVYHTDTYVCQCLQYKYRIHVTNDMYGVTNLWHNILALFPQYHLIAKLFRCSRATCSWLYFGRLTGVSFDKTNWGPNSVDIVHA